MLFNYMSFCKFDTNKLCCNKTKLLPQQTRDADTTLRKHWANSLVIADTSFNSEVETFAVNSDYLA